MNLTDLKNKRPADLAVIAEQAGVEDIGNMHKQDITFSILKALAKTYQLIGSFIWHLICSKLLPFVREF